MSQWITETAAEIIRQDGNYGTFGSRMPVGEFRLGLAVLQDEVTEALDAWNTDRKNGDYSHTVEELLQVAAVAIRLRNHILSRKGQ